MRDDDESMVVTTWDNGSKASVSHVRDMSGTDYIAKAYRSGHFHTFFRELLVLKYLGPRVSCVPSVRGFDVKRRVTHLKFVDGERVLEWVLQRFGGDGIDIASYSSFHGLETNEIIKSAFDSFKKSKSDDAISLRKAISRSYAELHRRRFSHGDPSPRNLIYDGVNVTLIDFDHSRPSLWPHNVDGEKVQRWYGITF